MQRHAADSSREHIGAERGLIKTVEHRRFILLQIAIVRERQALREREQRMEIALQTRRFAAKQFARIGIFFLRHQRGARAKRVG